MQKIISIILLSLFLTACGFHLRGYEPIPQQLKTIYVETKDPYSHFTKQLKQILTSSGVQVVSNPQPNAVTLQILSTKFDEQVNSIGSSGQNTIYLLSLTVLYQLRDAQGQTIQAPRSVITFRNYSAGTNQLLGDSYVERGLHDDMQRDVIYQLISRLQSYK